MSKNKVYLYDHFCDPESGYSEVSLMTPQGVFVGTANCNLDEDVFNEITGGSIAELRAWKAYYKYEIRVRKFALHELETVYSQMRKTKACTRILDRIEVLKLEIDQCMNELTGVNKEIDARIERLGKKN